jgi:putative GTP pyrophosphokinase
LKIKRKTDGILKANWKKEKKSLYETICCQTNLLSLFRNKKPFDTLMSYYQCAIMEVETKFKVLSEEYSLEYDRNPIENIKSRVKSFDSLLKKIRRKNIPLTMTSIEENIQDIAGVRVICSFPDDIYRLADCLLSQDDIILLEKKDYIKNPKPSGYRSLHLIIQTPIFLQEGKRMVTVEVQLRTIAMDFWASLEHKLRYKKNISEEQSVFLAEEMSQCAEISASLDERMQKVKDMLIQSEEESKGPEKSTRLLNLINR